MELYLITANESIPGEEGRREDRCVLALSFAHSFSFLLLLQRRSPLAVLSCLCTCDYRSVFREACHSRRYTRQRTRDRSSSTSRQRRHHTSHNQRNVRHDYLIGEQKRAKIDTVPSSLRVSPLVTLEPLDVYTHQRGLSVPH